MNKTGTILKGPVKKWNLRKKLHCHMFWRSSQPIGAQMCQTLGHSLRQHSTIYLLARLSGACLLIPFQVPLIELEYFDTLRCRKQDACFISNLILLLWLQAFWYGHICGHTINVLGKWISKSILYYDSISSFHGLMDKGIGKRLWPAFCDSFCHNWVIFLKLCRSVCRSPQQWV